MNLFVPHFRIFINFTASKSRVCLRVKRGNGGEGTDQHAHRMSVVAENGHHASDIGVDECMGHDSKLNENL